MIKSYRGLLKNSEQQHINLHTNDGKTGYRIVKFELLPYGYGGGATEMESVVKIYSKSIALADRNSYIDFSETSLLAAAIINNDEDAQTNPTVLVTLFDNEIFNQDIFIYHKNNHADGGAVSYYFELEQMSLDLNEATVATLQSIRSA